MEREVELEKNFLIVKLSRSLQKLNFLPSGYDSVPGLSESASIQQNEPIGYRHSPQTNLPFFLYQGILTSKLENLIIQRLF